MTKRRHGRVAIAASAAAMALAVYEFAAIVTGELPPLTEVIEAGPDPIEYLLIGGLILWLMDHFGWLDGIRRLFGRERK